MSDTPRVGTGIEVLNQSIDYLRSGDTVTWQIENIGDGAFDDKIITLFGADSFAKLALILRRNLSNARLGHSFIDDATKINLRNVVIGKIFDGGGFAAATHTNNCQNFYIVIH